MGSLLVVLLGFLGIVALIVLFGLFNAALIYYAWNLAVVPIFHMQSVTLLQAFLLGILLNVLGRGVIKINRKG